MCATHFVSKVSQLPGQVPIVHSGQLWRMYRPHTPSVVTVTHATVVVVELFTIFQVATQGLFSLRSRKRINVGGQVPYRLTVWQRGG